MQRCKLIYAFEGGLRGSGGTAACTILISSRTMSVQLREIPLSPKERRLLYSFPSAKTSGAETFATETRFCNARTKVIDLTCSNFQNLRSVLDMSPTQRSSINSFQKRHYEIDHQLFLLRFGTGDHHSKCDKRMVSYALGTILAQKQSVSLQEI